jgi:hypothetical protein
LKVFTVQALDAWQAAAVDLAKLFPCQAVQSAAVDLCGHSCAAFEMVGGVASEKVPCGFLDGEARKRAL